MKKTRLAVLALLVLLLASFLLTSCSSIEHDDAKEIFREFLTHVVNSRYTEAVALFDEKAEISAEYLEMYIRALENTSGADFADGVVIDAFMSSYSSWHDDAADGPLYALGGFGTVGEVELRFDFSVTAEEDGTLRLWAVKIEEATSLIPGLDP